MVREHRKRYIALIVEGAGISERELVEYLKRFQGEKELWLIYFDGKRALVRASHRDREEAIRHLNARMMFEGRVAILKTLGISGTIKKARRKYLGGAIIPRRRKGISAGRKRMGRRTS